MLNSDALKAKKEIDYAVSYVFGLIPFETVSEINGALGDAKVSYDIMSANKADMTEMIKKNTLKIWEFPEPTSIQKYISSAAAAKYVNEQIILNNPVYVKDIPQCLKRRRQSIRKTAIRRQPAAVAEAVRSAEAAEPAELPLILNRTP